MPTAQSTTYYGAEVLISDNTFFVTYAGEKVGFGMVYVRAADYSSMDFTTPGDLVFLNDDGTGVTLQNIYCVKSVVVQTDSSLQPLIYALYLTDAKYMWRKKYISGRYNVKNEDYSGYISFTLNVGVPFTQAEILNLIQTAGNITGAAYTDNLDVENIDYMNLVFDDLDTLSAMQAILEEVQGYIGYDTVNNTLDLYHYGRTNAATSNKIANNLGYTDKEFSGGIMNVVKEPSTIPATVKTVFSIYDSTNNSDFNDSTDRFISYTRTNGRPASFNANIEHKLYAHNLKMVRVAGVFADTAAMTAEAGQRTTNYYGRFTPGADHIFNKIIDFNIDEVVTGIMWQSTDQVNEKGEKTLSTMTHIRTYNFDRFDIDKQKQDVEKVVHETLFVEVDKTPSRQIIKSTADAGVTSFGRVGGTDYVGDVHVGVDQNITVVEDAGNNGVQFSVPTLGGLSGGGGVGLSGSSPNTGGMVWGAVMYVGAPNANGQYDNINQAATYLASAASIPNTLYIMPNGVYADATNGTFPAGTVIHGGNGVSGISGNITSSGNLTINGNVTTGNITMGVVGNLIINYNTIANQITGNGNVLLNGVFCLSFLDSGVNINRIVDCSIDTASFTTQTFTNGTTCQDATVEAQTFMSTCEILNSLSVLPGASLSNFGDNYIQDLLPLGAVDVKFGDNHVAQDMATGGLCVDWTWGDNVFDGAVGFGLGDSGTFQGNTVKGLLAIFAVGALADPNPLGPPVLGVHTGYDSATYGAGLAAATLATAAHNDLRAGMA
jgi:hypothetical protein